MTLVYDDTWLREPNLLVPGKKPVGAIRVDRTHFLSQGLIHYWPFVEKQPGPIRDIVGNANGVANSGLSFKSNGRNYGLEGTATTTTDSIPLDEIQNFGSVYTLMAFVRLNARGIIMGEASTRYGLLPYDSNTFYHKPDGYTSWGPTEGWTDAQIYDGSDHLLTVTRNGTTCNLYRDADNLGEKSISGDFDNVGSLSGYTNNNFTIDGTLYFCAVWDRALSAGDVSVIVKDPYQFLVPA